MAVPVVVVVGVAVVEAVVLVVLPNVVGDAARALL
jgi:hypothetical protein